MKFLFCTILLLLGYAGWALQPIDVQQYRFEIALNDASDAITGKATITIKFLEDVSFFQLDLVSVQDEKGMYAFMVQEGQQLLPSRHIADHIQVTLIKPARKNEVRSFQVQYMGTPQDGLIISKNKYGDRTFFSDNWPDRAHHWIPCNDNPIDKAAVTFVVTAPAQYSVVANGIKQSEVAQGKNKVTTWVEEQPLPTKVMAIGVARFAVKTYPDAGNKIPVSAWVYPQDSTAGFYDYALAPGILQFFSQYIAPYPYKKLANVQSKTIFGGMENASAIFYAEQSVTGTRKSEDLLAHEIAHQWFGNTATEKSFPHLWLSEGFATYLTNIYLENKYGSDTLKKRMAADRQQVIAFAQSSSQPVVDSTSNLMDLLNANSYQKGSWVLHMLRQEVGDTLFRKILQTYFTTYQRGNAESADFEQIAQQLSGHPLQNFFRQWLHQPGVPVIDLQWQWKNNTLELTFTQKQKMPFDVMVDLGLVDDLKQMAVKSFHLTGARQTFSIPSPKKPMSIVMDPNTRLLFIGSLKELH